MGKVEVPSMNLRILALASALLAGAPLAAQPLATQLDTVAGIPAIDNTTQTQDVGFKTDRDDRMTVAVRLSGTGPYRFLVDTGADKTAISRQVAGRLKLASGASAALHSVAGVSTVSTANVPSLELARKDVAISDAPLLDSANMGADGILGVDSLSSQRVQFDFQGQTMSIVPSRSPDVANEPGAIVVQARRKKGRLLMTDATANGHDVAVVVDTGAQVCIGNGALRQELTKRELTDPMERVQLESVTGDTISGDYMFVHELVIGGITLKNLAVVFTDAHTFHQLGLDRKPALLLGMNAMRAFKKVSIDFANRKFRVVLPEASELDTRLASAS
jgi:predicted aspartyl protease